MMSPASQGNLDVEHYTGSHLISARVGKFNPKNKTQDGKVKSTSQQSFTQKQNVNRDQYQRHVPSSHGYLVQQCDSTNNTNNGCYKHGGTWAGVPLISMANNRRNKSGNNPNTRGGPQRHLNTEDRTPLSRLAIHTQGAPLILSGRYSNTNRKNHVRQTSRTNSNTTDCLSVASDESSGSGQSENCLPRIIKPRKRRKKDRKPSSSSSTDQVKQEEVDDVLVVAAVPVTVVPPKSAVSVSVDQRNDVSVKLKKNGFRVCKSKQKPTPDTIRSPVTLNKDEDHHTPSLNHNFEDVFNNDDSLQPSSCQCRYCEPSGIWDAPVDNNINPPQLYQQQPTSPAVYFPTPPSDAKSFHYYQTRPCNELMLRRCWSEPTRSYNTNHQQHQPYRSISSSSDIWSCNYDANEQWESLKGCDINSHSSTTASINTSVSSNNSSAGDVNNSKVVGVIGSENKNKINFVNSLYNNVNYNNLSLQVSTEIVTSLNGHRDLEIKFFSSSQNQGQNVLNKSNS